ncbi:MAG TPA: type II secretion system F family protein [Propionibacteriaceae bacterium]|nr:type II secretion system F family protein [Propionibacteriaceae bacterium]
MMPAAMPSAVPTSVLAAVMAVSLALPLLGWAVLTRPDPAQRRIVANLQRGLTGSADGTGERVAGTGLQALARRLAPGGTVRRLERLLSKAGRPAAWPVDRLLAVKLVLPCLAAALSLLLLSANPGPKLVLLAVAVTTTCYFLPELLLHSRGQERSQRIALELADTMDQMTIAVEAGLGFDSAMARAGKNGKGPLAEELVRTLQDMQLGHSRRQAYESLAARTGVPDLRKFIRAVIQADMYGIAVADVLRTQAAEMRMKRRQRAEEKAMQIPVKVIFPLMLFILPVLFIVLLGPAAMDMVAAFS